MADLSPDRLVALLDAGEIEAAAVPLPLCGEVAEQLARSGKTAALVALADRALPRLAKKDKVEALEEIWLACCSAGALPLEAMLGAAETLAAHGLAPRVAEPLALLVDALVQSGRADDGLRVVERGLELSAGGALVDAACQAVRAAHAGAPNLEDVILRLRAQAELLDAERLRCALRALRFPPGSFVQWPDLVVAQVVTNDGSSAQVRHPSGATEARRVDGSPEPRLLRPDAHEVRRLYEPVKLARDWLESPAACLRRLLEEHGGFLSVPALRAVVVPRVVPDHEFEPVVERLRADCSSGSPELPTYDSRRRLFVSPGAAAPEPTRSRSAKPRRAASVPARGPSLLEEPEQRGFDPTIVPEQARWIDLTTHPEIRALLGRFETEVTELTRELNVDLPRKLEEARAHGDLRENAEYDAAKERLSFVQARIGQLKERVAKLRDLSRVRVTPGRVTLMSEVTVETDSGETPRSLRVVPADLPESRPGDVSVGTPYAAALMGRVAGETVVVRLPRRTETLTVLAVVDPS